VRCEEVGLADASDAEQVQAALDYFKLHRESLLEDTRQRDAEMRKLVEQGIVKETKIS